MKEGIQVFVTGDYWHEDFRNVFSQMQVATTMVPLETLNSFEFGPSTFGLIVLALSRRNQVSQSNVELLRSKMPVTPIVALKSSWCEGETRTGIPLEGVVSVFWHQWQGQFEAFLDQLTEHGIADWNLPATSSPADRVDQATRSSRLDTNHYRLGVSAWSQSQFDMIQDALRAIGWQSFWIERTRWDQQTLDSVAAICIDANSVSDDLKHRLKWLKNSFERVPHVLLLNFPRIDETNWASELGVHSIVSKPFQLVDLKKAVEYSIKTTVYSEQRTEHIFDQDG